MIPGRGDKVRKAQMCENNFKREVGQCGLVSGVEEEGQERKPVRKVGPDCERV